VYHIHASCTVFHPENSAKKSLWSTIMIQRYGTAQAYANADTEYILSLRALTTPLILHTNLHRRLRELLLRLALAVHLVLFAGRITADVLLSVSSKHISINPPLHEPSKPCGPSLLTLSPPCCWQTAHPAGPFCGWRVSSRGSCLRSRRWRFLRLWC
jgi:hypothetical protein